MEKSPQLRWYALSVYARQEKAAHAEISGLGLESFLPTSPIRRLWSDRIKQLHQPLFPGYLFVRLELTPETRIQLIRLRPVIDLVGKNWGYTASVPDGQIDSLKLLIKSKKLLEPTSKLVVGAEIVVSQGPLKGACGIIEKEALGNRRLVVQIPLLGRGVRAELSIDDVLSYEELGFTTGERPDALL